jgi:hypothetical protein
MLGSFVSGYGATIEVKESPLPALFRDLKSVAPGNPPA